MEMENGDGGLGGVASGRGCVDVGVSQCGRPGDTRDSRPPTQRSTPAAADSRLGCSFGRGGRAQWHGKTDIAFADRLNSRASAAVPTGLYLPVRFVGAWNQRMNRLQRILHQHIIGHSEDENFQSITRTGK